MNELALALLNLEIDFSVVFDDPKRVLTIDVTVLNDSGGSMHPLEFEFEDGKLTGCLCVDLDK